MPFFLFVIEIRNQTEMDIYTDGCCKGNPGKGGWGVYCKESNGTVHEYFGAEDSTTNNRMEMTAVIRALETFSDGEGGLSIYTDSTYVYNGITKWIHGWKKNHWMNSQKQPVKNRDLWEKLDALVVKRPGISFFWVKGHANIEGNENADRLANLALKP